jgi:anti-sigma28 factor (negative regulator of flagellin synthesis)
MGVGAIDGASGSDRVEGPSRIRRTAPVTPPEGAAAASDRVEISDQARLLSDLRTMPEIRGERVEELRRQIETGRFDTEERLGGAVEGFLSDNSDLLA